MQESGYISWILNKLKIIMACNKGKVIKKRGDMMPDILQRDGLTIEILSKLSYKSELGTNLKKNLHYFDKEKLFEEIKKVNAWYDGFAELHELALDYRIKSVQFAMLKYERYYP